MRQAVLVAALYDVHGNLPALDAVLDEVAQMDVDLIVFGGDIAAGAFPRDTLARVRELSGRAFAIRGNADRELLEEAPRNLSEWPAGQLDDDDRAFLRSLPPTLTVAIEGLGETLFCHATPRSDEETITQLTPDDIVRDALGGVTASVVVCGHTHMQYVRDVRGIKLVNAGSVGMPYEDRPGAYWALVGGDIEHRRTEYDLERAAALIRATEWPMAEEIAAENVLTVPPPAEVAPFFEHQAGR
jgi:predicted phosphodiesterase